MAFDPDRFVPDPVRAHALAEFPKESCGLVIGGRYHPCVNTHPEPQNQFRIRPEEHVQLVAKFGPVEAVLHSHCSELPSSALTPGLHPDAPSRRDMEGQLRSGWPWGIVVTNGVSCTKPFFWGDFTLDLPLVGQAFRHGANDCYTAIRRWHWQMHKRKLPEFPRDDEWWGQGLDLYLWGFAKAGFQEAADLPQAGDVFLTKIRSSVCNHGFVYAGQDLIYHHLAGRVSRHEPASRWLNAADLHLRFVGA